MIGFSEEPQAPSPGCKSGADTRRTAKIVNEGPEAMNRRDYWCDLRSVDGDPASTSCKGEIEMFRNLTRTFIATVVLGAGLSTSAFADRV